LAQAILAEELWIIPCSSSLALHRLSAMTEVDKRSPYLLDMCRVAKGAGQGPMGTHKISIGPMFFNLPVTLLASGLLWGLAIYCMISPDDAKETLSGWQSSVTGFFTWAYIGSNGLWLFFIIGIYWFYGDARLGKDGEKPQYDDANYFMMIFCAGVGIGLIFYGAAEPMYHYIGASNRYTGAGYLNDNEKAQHAMNLTLYHWGVHGWVVYTLTAVCLGILAYRYDLPLTYRTCFFPIFGRLTWGWLGDLIDGCTIAGCIAGVCTSLGLGAQQIVTGAQRIEWVSPTCADGITSTAAAECLSDGETTARRCAVIGVITIAATVSVVSGLDTGIKLLSQIAFGAGMLLWCIVFVLDDPWYLLNLMVQSFGYYLQWITQLGWFTDAFGQLTYGEGKAVDEKGANPSWMDWWTIFYWGWWIAWSPFVGIFLCRISRGRTIKEVINFTFTIPLLYCILWFCTFGGAGIKMHRKAALLEKAGLELYNNSATFVSSKAGLDNCYDVPATLACPDSFNGVGCPTYTGDAYHANTRLSPVCKFGVKPSDTFWFDLMDQYYKMGPFLSTISIFTICIYFITSSDSGSLVVDYIASNGEEAHVAQRVYWAFTEGGLAIALLTAGGTSALKALQAVSIVSGVPLTIFVCFICLSTWVTLRYDQGNMDAVSYIPWSMQLTGGVLDYIEYAFSCGTSTLPPCLHLQGFVSSTFFPPVVIHQTYRAMKTKAQPALTTQEFFMVVLSGFCFLGFLACLIGEIADPSIGLGSVAFFCYCFFVSILVALRYEVRTIYNIEGGGIRDSLACFFLYPQALWQARMQVNEPIKADNVKAADDMENQVLAPTIAAGEPIEADKEKAADMENQVLAPPLAASASEANEKHPDNVTQS